MKVKILHALELENGSTLERGREVDLAIRTARALISSGHAKPVNEEVKEVISYSKDNPPPEVQEVELPEGITEQIDNQPKQESAAEKSKSRRSLWHKIKTLWRVQE